MGRQGLRAVLEAMADMEAVDEAASGGAALGEVERLRPPVRGA